MMQHRKIAVPATFALALVFSLTACAAQKHEYREEIVDRSTDHQQARPDWVASGDKPGWMSKLPKGDGRMYLVTTSSDAFDESTGTRLAKAYALAQLSEQARTEVKTNSKLTGKGQAKALDDTIEWSSSAIFRSLNQESSYWEKRKTNEGQRYSVWVLWSIPEKAFYEAQQEALSER